MTPDGTALPLVRHSVVTLRSEWVLFAVTHYWTETSWGMGVRLNKRRSIASSGAVGA
ncbi:hypothetical protein [Corallincola holothuriorum]|uniref:hypothetical protein n=1 Tax=Corallincola holothuriorum TaxID=2282215 RepID=UPI001314B558|nr:hypothetical protein [Corallincola holothuriorum]